jgi:uncharacterized integral membrane protein
MVAAGSLIILVVMLGILVRGFRNFGLVSLTRLCWTFALPSLVGFLLSVVPLSAFAVASQISCNKPELRAEGRRSDPDLPDNKEQVARALSVASGNNWRVNSTAAPMPTGSWPGNPGLNASTMLSRD